MFLCQRKYALDIISETRLLDSKPIYFFVEHNHHLARVTRSCLLNYKPYRRMIGRLIYLDASWLSLLSARSVLIYAITKARSLECCCTSRLLFEEITWQRILLHFNNELTHGRLKNNIRSHVFLERPNIILWLPLHMNSNGWKVFLWVWVFFIIHKWFLFYVTTCLHYIWRTIWAHQTHWKVECHFVRDAIKEDIISTSYVPTTQLANMLLIWVSTRQIAHFQFACSNSREDDMKYLPNYRNI